MCWLHHRVAGLYWITKITFPLCEPHNPLERIARANPKVTYHQPVCGRKARNQGRGLLLQSLANRSQRCSSSSKSAHCRLQSQTMSVQDVDIQIRQCHASVFLDDQGVGTRLKYADSHVKQWRLGSRTFTITSYEPISWAMAAWYWLRDLLNFTELPGCNICVRRDAFFAVGGLHPVPQGLGIDAVFSFELRRLARMQPHRRLRFLVGPSVMTAGRHLSLRRSLRRPGQVQRYVVAQAAKS